MTFATKFARPKTSSHQNLEIVALRCRRCVIQIDPSSLSSLPEKIKPVAHQRKPQRVLNAIVVVLECAPGVVRRVDVDALDLAGELLFQRLEREQVVAEDEPVVEEVVIRDAVLRVVGLLRVFEQDARLKPGPVLLPDPGEFEFGFARHALIFGNAKSLRSIAGLFLTDLVFAASNFERPSRTFENISYILAHHWIF